MTDEALHSRIEELIEEEQALYERAGQEGGMTEDEHRRLRTLEVRLDQLWDLLRQRRALREAGREPSEAHLRDPDVVEHYEQ